MPPRPLSRLAGRARYIAQQGSRVTWYAGQAYRMRRLQRRAIAIDPSLKPDVRKPEGHVPGVSEMLRGIADLSARDLSNIEAGIYPAPAGEESWGSACATQEPFSRTFPRLLEGERKSGIRMRGKHPMLRNARAIINRISISRPTAG